MVSPLSPRLSRPTVLRRLLRFVVVPAAAGVVLGFALLWFDDSVSPPASNRDLGYADAVDRAAAAVVNIVSRRIPRQPPICELPSYRLLCERFLNRGRRLQGSLGSGVVVRPDGYILTSYHVIAAGDDIVVTFQDGRQAQAVVIGADPDTDLAVLGVEGSGFPAIEWASSQDIRVGDIVLAIGNPFGFGQAVSLGIVSAKGRYGIGSSLYDDFIQTDAAVNPGNSGGALVDRHGRLVGINTLIYSRGGGSDGIGFAIPTDRAIHVLERIVEHGRVLRDDLGVRLSQAPPEGARAGLGVLGVVRGSPADQAGVRTGDLLLSIDGEPATTAQTVTRQLLRIESGTRLSIRLLRNGAVRTAQVVVR